MCTWGQTRRLCSDETQHHSSGDSLGSQYVKHQSNILSIAHSSGESDLYGPVKGVASGLGLLSLPQDCDNSAKLEVVSDRVQPEESQDGQVRGQMRHVVQARIRGRDKISQIRGKNNPADRFTKSGSEKLRENVLKLLGFVHVHALQETEGSGAELNDEPWIESPLPFSRGAP